jgi:hypothetical protein
VTPVAPDSGRRNMGTVFVADSSARKGSAGSENAICDLSKDTTMIELQDAAPPLHLPQPDAAMSMT